MANIKAKMKNMYDVFTLTSDKLANMTEEELQQYVMRRGREQDMTDIEASEEFKGLNKQRLEHRGRKAASTAETTG
tara:strand:- start:12 stop:239 length:228 start_codon:yes stop_codon:yes gene_type:complete